jgi:putative transposase
VHSRIATGPRDGQRVLRFGDPVEVEDYEVLSSPRCVTVGGLSLHAELGVPARDRRRLQRLCRYTGRPPLATQRLSRIGDGRLLYRLKRRWRDGTTHVVFEPLELLEKLAALVPPPRIHQVRYHGVLGPAARDRPLVVPAPRDLQSGRACLPMDAPAQERNTGLKKAAPGTTLPWAELIRRVFAVDVLECPRCGGRMKILAAIQTPEAIRSILEHLDLPSRAPPITPARCPRRIPGARSSRKSPNSDKRQSTSPSAFVPGTPPEVTGYPWPRLARSTFTLVPRLEFRALVGRKCPVWTPQHLQV